MRGLVMGVVAVLAAGGVVAQEAERTLILGGGVVVAPRYPGSSAMETTPIPLVIYRQQLAPRHSVYFEGIGGGYAYQVNDRVSVGLEGNYRGERDNDVQELSGMREIDGTLEAGPKVRVQLTPKVGLEASLKADLLDEHGGYVGRVGADYRTAVTERLNLTAGTGLNYGSEDFTDSYFGVRGAEALPGRPAYSADAGFTHVDARVGANYQLTDRWSMMGSAGVGYLLGDAADSPITETRVQPAAMLGVGYRF